MPTAFAPPSPAFPHTHTGLLARKKYAFSHHCASCGISCWFRMPFPPLFCQQVQTWPLGLKSHIPSAKKPSLSSPSRMKCLPPCAPTLPCSSVYHSTYHVAPGAVYQSVSAPSTVSTQRVRTSSFGFEPGTQWILGTSLLNG